MNYLFLLSCCLYSEIISTSLSLLEQQRCQSRGKRVIAHRGSSGEFPEHSLVAFQKAVSDGADVLELDTSVTRDGVVVVMHEPELSVATNAFDFKDNKLSPFSKVSKLRKVTVTSEDGYNYTKTDLWSFDFTFAQLQQLFLKQPLTFRNPIYDRKYKILSLQWIIENIIKKATKKITLLIEVKTCAFFTKTLRQNGMTSTKEELVLEVLAQTDVLTRPDLIELQSFDENCLYNLKKRAVLLRAHILLYKRSQLVDSNFRRWQDMKFNGIGVHKELITTGSSYDSGSANYTNKFTITGLSGLVTKAHNYKFSIAVWTFRNEDQYISWNFLQDPRKEILFYCNANVDGFISDFPLTVIDALKNSCLTLLPMKLTFVLGIIHIYFPSY